MGPNPMIGFLTGKENRHTVRRGEIRDRERDTQRERERERERERMPSDTGDRDCNDAATSREKAIGNHQKEKSFPSTLRDYHCPANLLISYF